MKRKNNLIMGVTLSATVALVFGAVFAFASKKNTEPTKATEPEYSVSLGNISAAEASAKSFVRESSGGAEITFNTAGTVNNLSGYVANMYYGDDSAIFNVSPITGLKEIRFVVANHANVKLLYGSDPNNMEYASETYDDTILNNEVVIDLTDAVGASYFRFLHFRGTGAYLKTFTITYACSEKTIRGEAFNAGYTKNVSYSLTDVVTMDIKFTSDSSTHYAFALLDNWSTFFGYFNLYGNGTLGEQYAGVSMRPLDDGYYRVTFDLAQLTKKTGEPASVAILFAHSTWTDASGYIDLEPTSKALNTLVTDYAFTAGTAITPASSMKLPADKELILDIQFSKDDEAGKQISMVLATDWSNMYGYFNMKNDGTGTWSGVGVQTLGERHYRYFFDINLLPKYAGSSPTIVDFVWANGGNTTANGTISIIEIL